MKTIGCTRLQRLAHPLLTRQDTSLYVGTALKREGLHLLDRPEYRPESHPEAQMLKGNVCNQVDQNWNAFWSGGISSPLAVIEKLTFLMFIKRLDDLHAA